MKKSNEKRVDGVEGVKQQIREQQKMMKGLQERSRTLAERTSVVADVAQMTRQVCERGGWERKRE